MPNAPWKSVERAIGKILGFTREGPAGERGPDGITDRLVVQVKQREHYPRYLWRWVNEIREFRDAERMPIVVFHAKGQRYRHSLVLVRLDDFVEYVKGAGDGDAIP
jgi:hypothetical protein